MECKRCKKSIVLVLHCKGFSFTWQNPIPTIQRVNKSIQPAIRKIPQKTAMI